MRQFAMRMTMCCFNYLCTYLALELITYTL